MMRLLTGFFLALTLVAGCKNFEGPFQKTGKPKPDPLLPIPEQQAYGRERYAIPEADTRFLPNTHSGYRN